MTKKLGESSFSKADHGLFHHREMESVTRIQALDKVLYISLCANSLGKDMNPSVLPWLAMGK